MKFTEKLLQIKDQVSHHPITLRLVKRRRPLLIFLSIVLLTILALTLFLTLKSTNVSPYTATYQIETQITFGDVYNQQTEKVIVNHLNGLYKSQRFVNDIVLLESMHNTPEGFVRCSLNEDEVFDCQRLGEALTKNIGRPPKVKGLQKSSPTSQKINLAGQDRPCQETTYTLPSAPDPNDPVQGLTATVCIDEQLHIPLTASFTIHYKVNDITQIKDLTVEQTRTITELNTTPNLSISDFAAPTTTN